VIGIAASFAAGPRPQSQSENTKRKITGVIQKDIKKERGREREIKEKKKKQNRNKKKN
jgi:hypothetical protein